MMPLPRRARRLARALASLLLLAAPAAAQDSVRAAPTAPPADTADYATVMGLVVDSLGNPISDADVSVVGGPQRAVTDLAGRFLLDFLAPGVRVFRVRAPGFKPRLWNLSLKPGQIAEGTVALERYSYVLPEVTVVGQAAPGAAAPARLQGFYRRRNLPVGTFLDRKAIDQRRPFYVADLFDMIPGVRVRRDPNRAGQVVVEFQRCPDVALFIDGGRIGGDIGSGLALVDPGDVEAIEVYKGTAQVPPEFGVNTCGAIAVWTRYTR